MRNLLIITLATISLSCIQKKESNLIKAETLKVSNQEKDSSSNYRKVKNKKTILIPIDNSDASKFGFHKEEMDESVGPMSIFLDENYLYITDPIHNNIKKINILNEDIKVSTRIGDKESEIREIAKLDKRFYALSDDSVIYVLNEDLKEIDEIKIDDFKGVKDIFSIEDNQLKLYRPIEDVVQDDNGDMSISVLSLNLNNSYIKDTIKYTYDVYEKTQYSTSGYHIRGDYYEVIKNDEQDVLKNKFGEFSLNNKIPNTYEFYDCKNICFNENTIAYFEIINDNIVITVLSY